MLHEIFFAKSNTKVEDKESREGRITLQVRQKIKNRSSGIELFLKGAEQV
jgi:hypothetical protein